MTRKSILKRFFIISLFIVIATTAALAQSTAFSFQGRLNDGTNPANGRYDLEFKLFNTITGGTQVGATLARPNTILINGVFSTTLDFGAAAFNNPNSVFIEIAVKPNGSPNQLTILGPRQQITAVPFALRATSAANADNSTNAVNAQNAVNATNATNATTATTAATATNALSLGGVSSTGWTRLNVENTGSLILTGGIQAGGNLTQPTNSNGLVKAMIVVGHVSSIPNIMRCYNGVTTSSSGNCGFSITAAPGLAGVDKIDFGFDISTRFVVVSAQYANGSFSPSTNNNGINYRIFNNTTVDVFTFSNSWADTREINSYTILIF
ncbi:MAG TPA: hypothetical protein VNB22_19880 [Pyrinomonadaceae bacterium]|jgi:hypothetical protein|nr:hypothetical protein [Pyrinomonadaceae bacterium]